MKKISAIVIGGSAGCIKEVSNILSHLPSDFSIPIIICCHRAKEAKSGLIDVFSYKTPKEISEPDDKEYIESGKVYLAPADYHLNIEKDFTFSLSNEEYINNSRPSIDITMETAANAYRDKLVGILLSGANKDGAKGLKKIKEKGGLTIIQDFSECIIDIMPKAALSICKVDHIMCVKDIINYIVNVDRYYKNFNN